MLLLDYVDNMEMDSLNSSAQNASYKTKNFTRNLEVEKRISICMEISGNL
jgi:hypothetical protein